MRILAIGLGGAGGRIVDLLYRTDRRSSKVECVQALAVDIDGDSLAQLAGLPDTSKLYFSSLEVEPSPDAPDPAPTAIIDIANVTARAQPMATGETDAIFICVGLGGSFGDVAAHLITALRFSVTEPVFGLFTLPCLAEGERCSAKAADDIEMLSPLLDGAIIFDNETWYKKIKAQQKTLAREEVGFAERLGFKKKQKQMISPAQKMFFLLNDAIVRRFSLILRAGEFKADGGVDLAEVVLDSGEVLNTIRGMGFITIGYAVEQLPSNPLNFFRKWRPTGYFADEHQKKASRIVELAKQAIYHEVSAPCDITSAEKALILIAGPSQELSLKGYMTVRKWIDRSIAGLETRSGDYPVTTTRFVAIIIMLSGLKNIPRIEELKNIRAQYRTHEAEESLEQDKPEVAAAIVQQQEIMTVPSPTGATPILRDEMITLQSKKIRDAKTGSAGSGDVRTHRATTASQRAGFHEFMSDERQDQLPVSNARPGRQHKHVLVAKQHEPELAGETKAAKEKEPAPLIKTFSFQHGSTKKDIISHQKDTNSVIRDQERQRIERELQKQRMIAIQGASRTPEQGKKVLAGSAMDNKHQPPQPDHAGEKTYDERSKIHKTTHMILKKQESRTIVLHKKTGGKTGDTSIKRPFSGDKKLENLSHAPESETHASSRQPTGEDSLDIWLKQAMSRKKDEQIENEVIRLKDGPRTTRDDALLHTDLKRDVVPPTAGDMIEGIKAVEQPREIEPATKKRERKRSDEDVTNGN